MPSFVLLHQIRISKNRWTHGWFKGVQMSIYVYVYVTPHSRSLAWHCIENFMVVFVAYHTDKITRKLDQGSLTSGYQFSYMLPPRGDHDDCTQGHWDMLIVCIWSKLPNSCAPSPPPVPSSFPLTKLTHPLIPAGKPSLFLPTANSTSELPKLCGSFECFPLLGNVSCLYISEIPNSCPFFWNTPLALGFLQCH